MPLGDLQDNTTGASRRRHGEAARPSRHRALAAVRRLVGQRRWRWPMACAIPSARPASSCAASSSARAREIDWFLHGMRAIFPEAWRDFAEHLPDGRARRSAGQLLPPPDRSQSRRPSPGGARLEPLRGGLLDALSDGARAVRIRSRRLRARPVAHRGALLRPRHLPAGRLAVERARPGAQPALHHRAGPLRHRLPAGHRRRAVARLAGGALRRSCPTPATARSSPAFAPRWSTPPRAIRLSVADDQLFAPRFPWEAA